MVMVGLSVENVVQCGLGELGRGLSRLAVDEGLDGRLLLVGLAARGDRVGLSAESGLHALVQPDPDRGLSLIVPAAAAEPIAAASNAGLVAIVRVG
jgi:hypothetical protein